MKERWRSGDSHVQRGAITIISYSTLFVVSVGLCPGLGKAIETKPWSVQRTNLLLQQPQPKVVKLIGAFYHINCKQ